MSHPLRGAAAIVGAADEVSPTGEIDLPLRTLEARVVRAALADAGIEPSEVDGLCMCTGGTLMHSVELAEQLGITPDWTDSTQIGGASYELYVEHAASAIAAGLCETVVIVYASTPRSSRKRGGTGMGILATPERLEWESPYGIFLPIGAYGLAANRHMSQYGTRPEELAQIAVDTRRWASMNDRAYARDPITVDDVLGSGFVAEPMHKLEYCLVTDGAGDRGDERGPRSGSRQGTGLGPRRRKPPHPLHDQSDARPHHDGRVRSGELAFAMSGLTPSDIDVVELYDSFTITVLLALEDLGFCAKGEGGPFVADGRLGPGGALPGQTTGGGLSFTHPGAFGMFLLVEAVRQLRGESGERQVEGAETAVAHGCGGVLSATSTVVLGTEEVR